MRVLPAAKVLLQKQQMQHACIRWFDLTENVTHGHPVECCATLVFITPVLNKSASHTLDSNLVQTVTGIQHTLKGGTFCTTLLVSVEEQEGLEFHLT